MRVRPRSAGQPSRYDAGDSWFQLRMDARQGQFVISVGHLCEAAALGRLDIEVVTGGQTRVRGVPSSPRPAKGDDEIDDSGFARTFRIADHLIALDDIIACTIHSPNPRGDREDGLSDR